jgi:hypothetical protein
MRTGIPRKSWGQCKVTKGEPWSGSKNRFGRIRNTVADPTYRYSYIPVVPVLIHSQFRANQWYDCGHRAFRMIYPYILNKNKFLNKILLFRRKMCRFWTNLSSKNMSNFLSITLSLYPNQNVRGGGQSKKRTIVENQSMTGGDRKRFTDSSANGAEEI